MIIGINQPTFLPWVGYFNLLRECDTFVFLDTVQCVKQSYIVRTRILDKLGTPHWLTADLAKHPLKTPLNGVKFLDRQSWCRKMQRKIEAYYREAPQYEKNFAELISILDIPEENLSEYNIGVLCSMYKWIFSEPLKYVRASELPANENDIGGALFRVLNILDQFEGVSTYLNSRMGVENGLYPAEVFRERGIALKKQLYQCKPYHQQGGGFFPGLSIIDLIMNEPRTHWADIIMGGRDWERIC